MLQNRRELLTTAASGFGLLPLAALLDAEQLLGAESASNPLAPRPGHAPATARQIIQIFCPGGLSHVDTWDYKSELDRRHGTPFDAELGKQTFAGVAGNFARSFWPFHQHGECGHWISDLFPRMASLADDVAFIHSLQSKSALHGPAMFMANSGFIRPGFPCMGAWVTYGLGSETENLPAFVVLPDTRGLPPGGYANWSAGFLPAVHQGTVLETTVGKAPVADLFPPPEFALSPDAEQASRRFLQLMNAGHARDRADTLLDARIAAYELAARLQLSAPEAVDLAGETRLTHETYALADPDIGPFGRQCLLARRLIERGVRFVQIFCGAENTSSKKIRPNWDSHEDLVRDHGYWGRILDTGASALLTDLKQRGLLDSTLVICTSEFGRQPFMQGSQKGRDHNPGVFTAWLAGGGIRGGTRFGTSDELGLRAADDPCYSYDLHATALHLLGLDHEKLTFYHNGIRRRLTDVHGHVIRSILR